MTFARGPVALAARSAAAALAALAALAATGSPAAADELHATRAQPLDEISHTVSVRITDGVAVYTVQRQFHNRGKVADEARLAIDLPAGAAATGLRIRAGNQWHAGELLDREVAADRYRELTGAGVYDPRDPALLFWLSPSELFLQIFPVMPGATSTVEYTLTVPTRYAAGRYWLTYPRVEPIDADAQPGARKLVDPVVTVQPGWTTSPGGIVIDGKPAEAGKPIAIGPPAREPWLSAGAGADADAYAPPDLEAVVPYSTSVLDVPASQPAELRFSVAKLRVQLQHPNLSELRLELVTPSGELVSVADGGSDTLDEHAAFDVQLPQALRAAGRWRLIVYSRSYSEGALARWSLAFGVRTFTSTDAPVFLPGMSDPRGLAVLGVEPPPMASWAGRLGRVVASAAHAFSRLELDAAPRLSAAPRRAQVVFVLDTSYSAGQDSLDTQLALIRAYLAHVPDAELEVIAVRRTARRVFGRFATAAEAPRLLDAAVRAGAFALGNGSALDDGARLAASLLAGRPGPHRVVLATDELVRSSLTEANLLATLATLAPSAVVHVVVPPAGGAAGVPSLARDDAASLAVLAASHHGILARLSSNPGATAADLAPAALELVRPTRIEHLAITGESPLSVGDVLREGEGLRLWEPDVTAATAPSTLSLTGKLWSDPVRLDLAVTPAFSTATAAFVFGTDQHGSLDEAEQRTVALAGRAVSPVTSYLAIEPGVRPSKIGLDEPAAGGLGWGAIGSGGYSTIGCGFGTRHRGHELASLIPTAACARAHVPDGPWSVKLSIETTRDEIVDVDILDGTDPLASCLAEAAWALRLPSTFDRASAQHIVELSSDSGDVELSSDPEE